MAGEWQETTLGEVLTLQRGFDLPESQRADGHYPVIASTGQVGTHATAMAKGPGVVIGRSGSLGGGQYIVGDFWPLNTTLWIKDFKGNDRRFCYYLLKSLDLSRFNAGSGVPTLNRNHIHPLPITITTSLAEQQAIACILGTLDDKIELNRQMNKTLEEMARAIFKSWFVDFDPVRAKSEGRDTGLPKHIADLFPDSFVDSELGEIPRGWRMQAFTDDIDMIGGGTPKTSEPSYWGGDISWFSIVDTPVDGEIFVIKTEKTITQEGVNNSSTRLLPIGTTIISARGTVGNLALVGAPMAMNQSCYGLHDSRSNKGYYLYFATKALVDLLRQRTHGSVFNTITRDTLNSIRVVGPPVKLRNAFERVCDGLMLRVLSALRETRILTALRDALLPKLISGELRIKDAERFLKEHGL